MLESVNVSEVLPFSGTVLPPKALLIAGALTTVRVADAGVPLPAAVELIVTLLVYELSVAETTLTLIEHEPVASEALRETDRARSAQSRLPFLRRCSIDRSATRLPARREACP